MDLLEKVYKALSTNATIVGALYDGAAGIKPDLTLDSGHYPNLVYGLISDTPALWGDDDEIIKRVTVQISVLTRDGSDGDIVKAVQEEMHGLEYRRFSTTRVVMSGIRITVLRYINEEESEC